jgi:SAM-dependent methyltransferase
VPITFDWNEHAGGWDDNPNVRTYANRAFAVLAEVTDIKGKRVFDFGCGTGLLTEKISDEATEIIALDPAQKMLDVLARKGLANVTPVAGELTADLIARNPAFEGNFDVIVASSALAFVPDYAQSLRLLHDLLRPGGMFVQWDWLATADSPDFGFTEPDIRDAMIAAGFNEPAITRPFEITRGDDGPMAVLMAVTSAAGH